MSMTKQAALAMYTVQDEQGIYQLATLDEAISCAQLEETPCRITQRGEFVADFDGKDTWTVAAKYAPVWRTFSEEE